ncbi:hypothetical protein JCM10908_002270 [Rhodotorula pacifica]|uniref:uncharacterized protein n=1 Tax=Rhodotorula pacifica TaxID=1495444 RepID=UPI00317EF086
MLADPGFSMMIGPRYGHLVTDVSLEGIDDVSSARDAFANLAYLRNVRHVVLPSCAEFAAQLGEEDGSDSPDSMRLPVQAALSHLIHAAPRLSIPSDAYHDTLALCSGPQVRSIKVSIPEAATIDPLATALAACPNLVELELIFEDSPDVTEMLDNLGRLRIHIEGRGIERLRIAARPFHTVLYDFAGFFAHSLRHLDLSGFFPNDQTSAFPNSPSIKFDNVHTLVLAGPQSFVSSCFFAATPTVFPDLRHAIWKTDLHLGPPEKLARCGGLRHFASARTEQTPPVDICIYLTGWQRSQPGADGVDRRLTDPFNYRIAFAEQPMPHRGQVFPHPLRLGDVQFDWQVNWLYTEIAARLQYAQRMADRAKATRDGFQLRRIMEALQECEWLQVESLS